MPTIQKLQRKSGETFYRAQVRREGRTLSKNFRLKSDATDWARRAEDELVAGKVPGRMAKRKTLAEAIERHGLEKPGRDRSKFERLDWWKAQLGDLKLAQVTEDRIDDCLAELAKGEGRRGKNPIGTGKRRSPATLNRYLTTLSAVLEDAKRRRWITENPARNVSKRTEGRGRERFLSVEERTRLLAACKQSEWPRLPLLVMMALATGARRGELLGLRCRDVDLDARRAYLFDTKNGESRTLPLPVRLVEELRRFHNQTAPDELVYRSDRDPRKPKAIDAPWRAAKAEAGIENFRFHDLRHTTASYLAMGGASLLEIADVLGHKTMQMVKRYSHLADHHKADLLDRHADLLLGGGKE